MTDRELMQQALDALECLNEGAVNAEIEALRARLAQPEPEPVAWMVVDSATDKIEHVSRIRECSESWLQYVATRKLAPLYTAPPQREWQGLTDEEVREMPKGETFYDFARAIEAKLKAKNAA